MENLSKSDINDGYESILNTTDFYSNKYDRKLIRKTFLSFYVRARDLSTLKSFAKEEYFLHYIYRASRRIESAKNDSEAQDLFLSCLAKLKTDLKHKKSQLKNFIGITNAQLLAEQEVILYKKYISKLEQIRNGSISVDDDNDQPLNSDPDAIDHNIIDRVDISEILKILDTENQNPNNSTEEDYDETFSKYTDQIINNEINGISIIQNISQEDAKKKKSIIKGLKIDFDADSIKFRGLLKGPKNEVNKKFTKIWQSFQPLFDDIEESSEIFKFLLLGGRIDQDKKINLKHGYQQLLCMFFYILALGDCVEKNVYHEILAQFKIIIGHNSKTTLSSNQIQQEGKTCYNNFMISQQYPKILTKEECEIFKDFSKEIVDLIESVDNKNFDIVLKNFFDTY